MDFSATFCSNPAAIQLYRNYVRAILTRENRINGRLFKEDPTIMSWQLVNEPRPGRDNEHARENLPALYNWIHETAKFIHLASRL